MNKYLIVAAIAMATVSCSKAPQLGKDSIDDVINAMTLEEKVHLVIGTGMPGFNQGDSSVVGLATNGKVPGAAGNTYPIKRLGIPSVVLADGPAGLRIDAERENDRNTYYCTHFPVATLLASSWDTDLVQQVGEAIGDEVLEYGADILLAPALNIHRNPLCGRNFEYYSEDPLLSGKIAAAYVRGVQSKSVGTSIKHLAGNNQETNRINNNARISPRALREIYLKGFEIATKEGKPWTVMSSYNYINDKYTSENPELITTILRDEWGFDGMVMTDWFGGKDAVKQMEAGNDMLQPGYDSQYHALIEAVKSGKLDEKVLDRNVRRVLEMIMKTPTFNKYRYSNKPDLDTHATITRQSAAEGMVLLKNDSCTLPFSPEIKNIALFGCTSYDFIPGGTGSGNVNRAYTVSLPEGLIEEGYDIDADLNEIYDEHIKKEKKRLAPKNNNAFSSFLSGERPVELTFPVEKLQTFAKENDVALITIGQSSGEFRDRTSADFNLTPESLQLIEDVSRVFHEVGKPVVVVLNIGGVIETASWKSLPDAILLAWQGGQEGANSVADILKGTVNPSGKLPMTFPMALDDHYSTLNFPVDMEADMDITNKSDSRSNTKNIDFTDYEEDIYVGYRFFDTFDKEVSYPFGYGLSYTDFEFSNPEITLKNGIYKIKVDVTNIGSKKGKEVVQLYVAAPDSTKIEKPTKELKAFAKTKELKPGETVSVTLDVPAADLASFNEELSAWVTEAGEYSFMIGSSSRNLRANITAPVEESIVKVNDVMRLPVTINRLHR